jgi:hypothetical protein
VVPGSAKDGVKSEMSSTQQYSLNFMNMPLNDDNNGECTTIGKTYSTALAMRKKLIEIEVRE